MYPIRYAITGLFLAGCATAPTGTDETPQASTRQAVTASISSAAAARSGGGPRLGKPDPEARKHPTGARQPTADEAARHAKRSQKVTGVKLAPLAIERIQTSADNGGLAPSRSSASASSTTAVEAAPLGSDLVTVPAGASATGAVQPASAVSSYVATTSTTAATSSTTVTLPKFVDNSKLKAFPPIANQGSLNSCEAFAIAYYQYTHEVGLLANWDNQSASATDKTRFSPKWLYNLANGGENGGTYEGSNYQIMIDHGALTLADFPYSGDASDPLSFRKWPDATALWEKALTYKGVSYASLSIPTDATSMQQVKTALLNGHVLTFFNYIYGWQFDQVDNDPSTTSDDAYVGQWIATWVDGASGGHLMTMVGYDDDIWIDLNGNNNVDAGEKGAFKIANSWGNTWNNAGFAWVAYDALFGTSQVAGMPAQPTRTPAMWSLNSVVVRSNYQPNLVAEFTLGTAERGNMGLNIGMGETDAQNQFSTLYPSVFSYMGGPYAFDGTTTSQAKTASFALDLSDFTASYGDLAYSLNLSNGGSIPASLSGMTFLDRLKSNQRTASTDAAVTVPQGQNKTQKLRYQFKDPSHVPSLTLNPASSIAFGNAAVGSSTSRTFTVQNTGTGDAILTSLRLNNALYYVTESGTMTVQAGTTAQLHVQFAPASAQSETATLTVRNTSQNVPSAALSLTGTGTSNDNNAPLVLYVTQQNDPLDNSIAMRVELKNRSTTTQSIANDRVVYYLNYPYDYSGVIWETFYNSGATSLTATLRHLYLTHGYGIRTADTALDFTFPAGTTIAAGASLIFQGSLHRPDYSWYPDETHDWSRYLRRDTMAESSVVQDVNSKSLIFGSSPEIPAGAFQLTATPNANASAVTATFNVTNSQYLNSTFVLELRDAKGNYFTSYYMWVSSLGTQSAIIDISYFPAGDYTIILRGNDGSGVDVVTFKK